MPIYEYRCESCGFLFEEVQKFSEPPLDECPDCGKNSAIRQVSMSAFHLKGGGWYKDGYSVKSDESGKEKKGDSDKKNLTKEKQSSSENSVKSANKESTSSNKSGSTGKEKAA
tara:strand:+ start:590 stop:928 length:339 start_codon:yes stop_codon:yes gene_type:complete